MTPDDIDDKVQTAAEEARAEERKQRLKALPCGHDSLDLVSPKAVEIIAEADAVENTCSTGNGTWVYDPHEG